MILYGLKTCDTCRKALKSLENAEFRDLRTTPVPPDVLKAAHARFGPALVNTRSTTWRNLPESERQRDLLDLLAAHPALMKRPLIVTDDGLLLGWDKSVQAAVLG